MDEKDFDHWLKNINFSESTTTDYDIVIPSLSIKSNPNCIKSDTLILPLSLEDNSTTAGTAEIMGEFGKEFGISFDHAKVYLPFDDRNNEFHLNAAREHHVFILPYMSTSQVVNDG
jgi:NAD kinase